MVFCLLPLTTWSFSSQLAAEKGGVFCLRPRWQFPSFSFHPSAKLRKKHEDATPSMLELSPVVPTLEGLAQQSLEPELPGNPLNPLNPSPHSSHSRCGPVGFLSKKSHGNIVGIGCAIGLPSC